jgi:hypothetical protein
MRESLLFDGERKRERELWTTAKLGSPITPAWWKCWRVDEQCLTPLSPGSSSLCRRIGDWLPRVPAQKSIVLGTRASILVAATEPACIVSQGVRNGKRQNTHTCPITQRPRAENPSLG